MDPSRLGRGPVQSRPRLWIAALWASVGGLCSSACRSEATPPREHAPRGHAEERAAVQQAASEHRADSGSTPPRSEGKGTADVQPEPDDSCRSWADLRSAALPSLPESKYSAIFARVWTTVLEKHFDPTLNCKNWPQLRMQYGRRLATAESRAQAYGVINALLAELGHSHLVATPPPWSGKEGDGPEPPRAGLARLPFRVRWIDDMPLILASDWGRLPRALPPGSILLAIDGHRVAAGEAGGDPNSPVSSRQLEFQRRHALERLTSCPAGLRKRIEYRPPRLEKKAASQTREVECVMPDAGFRRASLGNLQNLPTRVDSRMLESGIGYIAFNFWMMPMMADIRAAMQGLAGAGLQAVIIDLRGNPGGLAPMTIPVARLFLPDDSSLGTLKMRDFDQQLRVRANPAAFTGPMTILIDEATASTSEIFALGMRELGRASIVGGGASAGMALPSLIETLPDGGLLQYVVGEYRSAEGAVAEGGGVAPDHRVRETRADFVTGRDVVLAKGINLMKSALAGQVAER